MKKNSFINGALLVTLGIIVTKILGVIYVVPFHSLIGEKGGALYGYAYTIYVFFISISSAGIPMAISKIISEYNTLGNYDVRDRAFYLGKRISLVFGFVCFLLLNIFARFFSSIILGDLAGGNSIEDVTLVIRVISTAILIVPLLSIYRGYFQGFKYMEPASISQVVEQLVRIVVILVGSYMSLKIFKLDLSTAIGVAVFGATVGALVSYVYLIKKLISNRNKFKNSKEKIKIPVSDKDIIRKIFYYAFPLIMIDLSRSVYNFIDTFTVVSGLVEHANYNMEDAETVFSMLSTWGTKFNMIISSIATGIVVSLTPNLSESIVKKDENEIRKKITQAINLCLFLTVPMTFGVAFLSKPIWTLFYGVSDIGPILLGYFIFVGLISSLFTVVITIIQLFKDYKTLFISLLAGVLIKMIFNIPLIGSFYREGLPPYFGVITASILGYMFSIIYCFIILNIKKKVNFEKLVAIFMDILCGSFLMILVLFIVSFVIPLNTTSRIISLLLIILYAIIGMIVYFIFAYKSKTIDNLFGKDFINKVKKEIVK